MGPDNSETEMKHDERPSAGDYSSLRPYHPTLVESPFFLVSLLRQARERLREPKIARPTKLALNREALPITELPPWYRDIPNQIRILFEKPTFPRVPITSQPIDVPGIWRDYPLQPASWLNSILVHALVIIALSLPFVMSRPRPVKADNSVKKTVFYPLYKLETAQRANDHPGSGGGGDRSPTPASIGAVPRFDRLQFAPPSAKQLVATPKIRVTPTILGPPELILPEMALNMPWGDPHGVQGPPSNGPGFGGGIGNNQGTGVGPGNGGSLGPGESDGPPTYSVGGGVTAPQPVFSPAPDYSEEARKAKHQGRVVLSLVVDAQGNPTSIRVLQPLGMGLDEKAVEKVKTWKFVPGMQNRVPVPVRVLLEITFRLF